jgi:hypothetical protein
MDLLNISHEIKDLLEKRRKELDITFVEEEHVYYMRDTEGVLRKTFPSVSKLLKKFYKPFDSEGMALKMCKGDPEAAVLLQEEWKTLGNISTNLGSRVHYELETDLVSRYDSYKQVRRPIFECDQTQLIKSDIMISAGKTFIDLMQERGAVLLDTEIVLGDNILGYVGQPDKVWLMMNKPKTDFGIVVTDWKTNQPKNFEIHHYTGRMFSPFQDLHDNALGHYYLQLPFYARLLIKMLEGTKYENTNLLGCVVVLLKEDGTFEEYRVPPSVNKRVLELDLTNYINYGKKGYTYR